ncbi:iron(3+)-hydroxamate-binding protein fhuD [Paenibacillus psychroresistens]|uniref:Iron(3+)-hydroxamate-binding protein fhuD n=1 Tax=Paenibacillus psychroresistens TaxID=1778678 RepID=A0A6B8RDW4_9BACL|nr:iron-hydroxamate ABC transporter substrate-binding protein [Paenibacillus psychroresistens]QGQ94399.1 iron(3+)-hydroxamate-binding protein fhuD [Paenibacillus psychroresistens]
MKQVRSKSARSFYVLIVLIGLLVLSACGNSSKTAESAAPAASVTPAESIAASATPAASVTPEATSSASANETKIYKDTSGEVTIPKNPQRIVELTGSYSGNLLVLGIKPIGLTQSALDNPYFKGKVDGIQSIGDGSSYEKVLNLAPDLIISWNFMDEAIYEKFSKIAPVVRLEYGKYNYRDLLVEFGKITGKEQQAQEWLDAWNKKIADYLPKIQDVVGDKTVSILQPFAKGIYAFGDNYARGGEILYGDFKLKAPKIIQEKAIDTHTGYAEFLLELLPEYAGDFMFTSNWGWDDSDPKTVYDSSLWKNLPAVKDNRVYQIDPLGSYFNDPISLEAHLDLIVKGFLGE